MVKRLVLFCLGFWLIAASGLSAHAGPCSMDGMQVDAALAEAGNPHCDMMAVPQQPTPDVPDRPDKDAACCCPAVLVALPAAAAADTSECAFALPSDFPLVASAASRTLPPEPRPPKA